jgi:hypothetical protein
VLAAAGLAGRVLDGVDFEVSTHGSSLRQNCTSETTNGAT